MVFEEKDEIIEHITETGGEVNSIPEAASEGSNTKLSGEFPGNVTAKPAGNSATGKIIKRVLLLVLLALLAWAAYSVARIFITPDRNIQQIYLIPQDAAIIIQSSEPVKDWKKFSSSEPWTSLKGAASFADITAQVESLDSLIQTNKTLLSLVGKRDMIISLHKTRTSEFDFLIVVDLQKVSKMEMLKDQVENILKLSGNTVTRRPYKDISIIEMRDPGTRDILYTAFVDNHFVASYSNVLIQAAIDEREKPNIGLDYAFIEAEKLVAGKGLFRVYVNYSYLPQFLSIYLGQRNEVLDLICGSMNFAGMYIDSGKEKIELKGYTLLKDVSDPYVTALLGSGKQKMRAHEIMPARTALYVNLSFSNAQSFIAELEKAMEKNDREVYDSYQKARKKIENMFGISLEKNFISWMAGEFAFSQSEPGLLGQEPEVLLAVRAKSIKDAKKNMAAIEKRIRGRSPIKVKTVDYKGYEINYVEMKGFFRLFFGKLFDRFEKPYYTYVDDFVVFSNQPSSLLSMIEDYEQKNLLKSSDNFRHAFSNMQSSSTVYAFVDMHKFFPQLRTMLNAESWRSLQENRDVLYSFPQWSFQVVGEHQKASLNMVIDHEEYNPAVDTIAPLDSDEADAGDTVMEEGEDLSDKQLMNELKRFYVEKFEGNVLRDYYEDGALKSESEVKNGKRHGRYREFYHSGKLLVRGKYSNNQKKGTWKYYTEEGKFERKEKY